MLEIGDTQKYILNWQGKLSYAVAISNKFSVGINLSLLRIKLFDGYLYASRGKLDGESITALFDLGLFWKDLFTQSTLRSNTLRNHWYIGKKKEGLSLGMALLNLGSKISFINEQKSDNTPAKFILGSSYCPIFVNKGSVMLAIDFEKQLYEPSVVDYLHVGFELNLLHLVSLRMGRFFDTQKPKTSYNTYGAGISLKYFSLSIAHYKNTLLPTWHYGATFSMEF